MSDTAVPEGKPRQKKVYDVQLEAWTNQAWAAPAAFALLREQAELCGLDGLGPVHVNVIVNVDGHAYPEQIEELKVRMERLALGEVEVKRERELRNG
jgi:hypothetical protein